MADRDKVDELVIELTARDKATEKIDNLAKSLRGLGDSLTTGLSSAKMNSVASSLRDIGGATTELGRSTRAINNLPKLTTELSNMMNTLHDAPSISKDVLSLAHALSKIDGSAIKGFSKIATPKIENGSATQEMKAVESEMKHVDSQTKEVSNTFDKLGGSIKGAFSGVPRVLGNIGKIDFGKVNNNLNSILGKVGNLSKKVFGLYKNISLTHKLHDMSLKKGFTTLLRYTVGIRSLFVLANRIRSAIEDGNKNLAQYSAEFNKSMSLYKSGLGTMKNALSVAFAPLVNYFSEAINKILDSFIEAFNTIARLMARLTGAKQVVQATRYYNDFASSLGKASKNAKQLTTGIDELNILNDSSGSGSGGASTGVQDMFETVDVTSEFDSWINKLKDMWDKADFTDLGTALADKINGALQNIDWKTIQKNARKLGKSLATFLNGVFEEELNGQTFGYTIGKTIGEAINTGIEFSYAFVTNFHWKSFGQFIADCIKGALETINWKKWARSLHKFVNGMLEALTTLFSDKQLWIDLGKSIGEFFSGLDWKETWFNFTKMLKALGSGIKTALKTWKAEDPDSFSVAVTIGVVLAGIKLLSGVGKIGWGLLGKGITDKIAGSLVAGGITGAVTKGIGAILLPISFFIGGVWALNTPTITGLNTAKMTADLVDSAKSITDSLKPIGDSYSGFCDTVLSKTKSMLVEHKTLFGQMNENMSEALTTTIDTISPKIDELTEKIKGIFNHEEISVDLAEMSEETQAKFGEMQEFVQTAVNGIVDSTHNAFSKTKTDTKTQWDETSKNTGTTWDLMKKNNLTTFTDIKKNTITLTNQTANGMVEPNNAIISQSEGTTNSVIDGVNKVIEAINNATTFSWTNPMTGESFASTGLMLRAVSKLKLPRLLSSLSIPKLADGGFVPNSGMGSLFWAGESGAEVVAHANGGTEVLNASQVASAVTSGVTQAIVDNLIPYMASLVDSNNAIADKDLSVNIGDREIAEANRRGESELGLQLVTI